MLRTAKGKRGGAEEFESAVSKNSFRGEAKDLHNASSADGGTDDQAK